MGIGDITGNLGVGSFAGDLFSNLAFAFGVFIVTLALGLCMAVFGYILYVLLKYKWKVLIRVQREGENHYWVQDRGGNFINKRTGLQSFKLLKNKIDLPLIPAKSVEPMARGKSLVFLHKYDTGVYDYLPFVPEPVSDTLKQKTFDVDMQNFIRGKIKADMTKFKWKDFWEKNQIIISVGLIVIVLVITLYGSYKLQNNVASNLAAVAKDLIEAKAIACPTQVIPG